MNDGVNALKGVVWYPANVNEVQESEAALRENVAITHDRSKIAGINACQKTARNV